MRLVDKKNIDCMFKYFGGVGDRRDVKVGYEGGFYRRDVIVIGDKRDAEGGYCAHV